MASNTLFIASLLAFGSLGGCAILPYHVTQRDVITDPACLGREQGSTFTYAAETGAFDVTCGKDYFGGDLRFVQTESFKDCIAACDLESACVTVAYRDGACYLKSQVTSLSADAGVWSARKQRISAPTGLSCVDKVSDGQTYQIASSQFEIVCGQEYYGGDLAFASYPTFEACIAACVANTQCVDISYVNGACYLKQSTSALVSAPQVWTAKLTNNQPKLSCLDNKDSGKSYTAKNGRSYVIECGVDHYGGDSGFVDGTTFESCMDACDAAAGCVDVSWVHGACYLKNELNAGVMAGQVWTGRLVSGAQPSLSSSLSSSTQPPALQAAATSSLPSSLTSPSSSVSSSPSPTPSAVRPPLSGQNLLENSDFETGIGTNTTGTSIPGWTNPLSRPFNLIQRMEINGNVVRSGRGAVTLTQVPRDASSIRDGWGYMFLIPSASLDLAPGSTYAFSGWARQLSPGRCRVEFMCGVTAPGSNYSKTQTVMPTTSSWTQAAFTCIAPAEDSMRVQILSICEINSPWAQVYIDDVSLVEIAGE